VRKLGLTVLAFQMRQDHVQATTVKHGCPGVNGLSVRAQIQVKCAGQEVDQDHVTALVPQVRLDALVI